MQNSFLGLNGLPVPSVQSASRIRRSLYRPRSLKHLVIYFQMGYFSFHIWERTCGMCRSAPGLFYLTQFPPVPFIWIQMKGFCSFQDWIIAHCMYIHNRLLSIHPLSGFYCQASLSGIPWLLWMVLQWTWGCRHPFDTMFSFLMAIFPMWDSWITCHILHTVPHSGYDNLHPLIHIFHPEFFLLPLPTSFSHA